MPADESLRCTPISEDGETELRRQPDGPYHVAKFGGTSVGKLLHNIAEIIVPRALDSGHRLVLVCSARSGDTKATGTTNLLLKAATEALDASSNQASQGDIRANDRFNSPPRTPTLTATSERVSHVNGRHHLPPRTASSSVINTMGSSSQPASRPPSPGSSQPHQLLRQNFRDMSSSVSSLRSLEGSPTDYSSAFNATVDQIKADHIATARANIKNPVILAQLEDDLEYDCERLRSFLLAAQIIEEISLRSKDIIVGVGEKLSCRIVTAALRDRGIDAELVTLENIVEKQEDNEVKTLDHDFYVRLSERLGQRLRECGDRIPVVTGFFGVVPGSLLTQIGRGYTDFCAALCAVGIQASELQIWKEVDGIFTADPRKVPTARLLSYVTPEEAAELTYYGSEVIHPFTMEQVINARIPIRIKNVENPSGSGTVIFPDDTYAVEHAATNESSSSVLEARSALKLRRIPTAVTIKDHILVLNIRSNKKTISHGFFAKTFTILDKHGIIVDLISTSEVQLSLSMNGIFKKGLFDRVVNDLKTVGEVSYKQDMAILSLVGREMKNMVGIAGKMFTVLAQGNINIEAISQGASEMNVSCVIERRDAQKALNLVHHHLLSLAGSSSGTDSPVNNGPLW